MEDERVMFCLVANERLAELFVAWKERREVYDPEDEAVERYCMHEIETYVLSCDKEVNDLRRSVRNILDWGVGKRLEQIRQALDRARENWAAAG